MKIHPLQQINFDTINQAHVIEASAGTGKTWTIERLFIKALLEGTKANDYSLPLGIENILVVTFTNDATDELKSRISEQIQSTMTQMIYLHNNSAAIKNLSLDTFTEYLIRRLEQYDFHKDIIILNRAIQNFDQAAIYTIHGFCNKVLHDYQFDCGVNADFELVSSKSELISTLVEDFIRKYITTETKFSTTVDTIMANLSAMFIDNRGNQLTLATAIAAKLPKDLFVIANNSYQIKYNLNGTSPAFDYLTNGELSDNPEEFRIAKAQFMAAVIEYLAQTFPVLPVNDFQVSYDELIQKVADAVINNPSLADKLYENFPVAFVDEFQDTDNMQWQIFSNIYHLNITPRGHVVVVGDPKQAIYRFRGADVDTYLEAKKQIGAELVLEHNFRSHPNIMNFVNQLFNLDNQKITDLNQSFLGQGISYYPVIAAAKESELVLPTASELKACVARKGVDAVFYDSEVQLVAVRGPTKDVRQQKLLLSITFEILALLNENPELSGKIAILVTKNREAKEIVSFLSRYGIRASELKLGSIYATETAVDLFYLFSSLIDLSDRRAFIKALSSGLFNLPLTSIQLKTEVDNQVLMLWQQRFFSYKGLWESRGIISLIYALLKDMEADSHLGVTKAISRRTIANLWQLAELLNHESQRLKNNVELIFWFNKRIKSAQENVVTDIDGNSEELVRLDNDDEQIIITTQHKSKGLEYEVLFCPYFKSGIQLDGIYDFNYRRPFFSNYRIEDQITSSLVMDTDTGSKIVNNDNKEAHRLNYVALTRAKSRIYIYLKQPTITKSTGKYNSLQRPDKLVELFGYVANDPQDVSHPLFNYPHFFDENPTLAIKANASLPGVVAYNRDELTERDLKKLVLNSKENKLNISELNLFAGVETDLDARYFRQSYTALTRHDNSSEQFTDYYVSERGELAKELNYRYLVLNDKQLSGASFGVLFHELCENYPFSNEQLSLILHTHNVTNPIYQEEFKLMLDEAFSYPLINNLTLNSIKNASQHELEFNLLIKNPASFKDEVAELLADYFGANHPFSLAIKSLDKIEAGFLNGFIDLFFMHEDKYWVLDYKTNKLADYSLANSHDLENNALIDSMAEHHYYLQYLLYLVAIKRYLEKFFNVPDASNLIGGAIYFYVRAVYLDHNEPYAGIYTDTSCQDLVKRLDDILKGIG